MCRIPAQTRDDPKDMPSLDIYGELEKYYTVVSKIHTLTYRRLPILPIKLGKVCHGLEAEPFEFQIMVFALGF